MEGNVGIGTVNPTSKLHIYSVSDPADRYSGQLQIGGDKNIAGDEYMSIGVSKTGQYVFIQGAEAGIKDLPIILNPNSVSVGIGTVNVDEALDVYGAGAGASAIKIRADQNNYPNSGINTLGTLQFGVDGSIASAPVVADMSAYQDSGGYGLRFRTLTSSLLDRMIINRTGNVGIGTTSPGFTLDVNGDVNVASGYSFKVNGTTVSPIFGTFSPDVVNTGSTSSWGSRHGIYMKIGQMVHVSGFCDNGISGAAGTVLVFTGLPYSVSTSKQAYRDGMGVAGTNNPYATYNVFWNGSLPAIYQGGNQVTSQATFVSFDFTYYTDS